MISKTKKLKEDQYKIKYMFLRALSFIGIKDTIKAKKQLNTISKTNSETTIVKEAEHLLGSLNNPSKIIKANELALSESPYLFRSKTHHMSLMILSKKGTDVNYLKTLKSPRPWNKF